MPSPEASKGRDLFEVLGRAVDLQSRGCADHAVAALGPPLKLSTNSPSIENPRLQNTHSEAGGFRTMHSKHPSDGGKDQFAVDASAFVFETIPGTAICLLRARPETGPTFAHQLESLSAALGSLSWFDQLRGLLLFSRRNPFPQRTEIQQVLEVALVLSGIASGQNLRPAGVRSVGILEGSVRKNLLGLVRMILFTELLGALVKVQKQRAVFSSGYRWRKRLSKCWTCRCSIAKSLVLELMKRK